MEVVALERFSVMVATFGCESTRIELAASSRGEVRLCRSSAIASMRVLLRLTLRYKATSTAIWITIAIAATTIKTLTIAGVADNDRSSNLRFCWAAYGFCADSVALL